MTTEPMDCKDIVELVTAYLDDELDEGMRARFDEHLVICEGCAEYLEQMRTTVRMLGGIPDEALDPLYRDRLLAAFNEWG